jgi:hypothetical protein
MSHDNKTKLLDAIFRLFPNASIVTKSKLNPFEQTESTANDNPELAKREKPQRMVSLACKHKGSDSRQLSLFNDETKRGGT